MPHTRGDEPYSLNFFNKSFNACFSTHPKPPEEHGGDALDCNREVLPQEENTKKAGGFYTRQNPKKR